MDIKNCFLDSQRTLLKEPYFLYGERMEVTTQYLQAQHDVIPPIPVAAVVPGKGVYVCAVRIKQ